MRIVEINTVCDVGSTGRIAAGVARIARDRGHDVWFAYGRGTHPNDIQGYKIGNRLDFLNHVLLNFFRGKNGFGSSGVTKKFLCWLDTIQPDILHLHNLHGFYINVDMLFKYIKKNSIRVVWTLHDCWSFTGQCAYFDYVKCNKWIQGCYECPIFRSEYPYSLFCDNSMENYSLKREAFRGVEDLTIITPSRWLGEIVSKSYLRDYTIKIVNNGIDTDRFKVFDTNTEDIIKLKKRYNIGEERYVVLGVANIWSDRKGLKSFYKLAETLSNEYVIVLIGVNMHMIMQFHRLFGNRMIGVKHTESIYELALWYNIADVYVNPTLEDNFPTTNIEALSCGTPVVTYETGGSPEIIDINCGICVDKEDIESMKKAIVTMAPSKAKISNKCRERVIRYFDMSDRLAEYVDIMEKM